MTFKPTKFGFKILNFGKNISKRRGFFETVYKYAVWKCTQKCIGNVNIHSSHQLSGADWPGEGQSLSGPPTLLAHAGKN